MSEDMDAGGPEGGEVKKFMYMNRKAPYGTIYALEALFDLEYGTCLLHLGMSQEGVAE